jgi:hypothetical protein
LGRKTRLAQTQREQLWSLFEKVRNELVNDNLLTEAGVAVRAMANE